MAVALANRYARALVDVALKPGAVETPQKIAAGLADFLSALGSSAELRGVLASPAVAPEKKRSVLAALGEKLELGRTTQNFLRVVVDRRRLSLLGEMVSAFQALLDERAGIVRAEVTAAQPVEEAQQAALAEKLSGVTGKRVLPQFAVDPALLGGAVARIGSTIYDGSVRGRLRTLGRKLATEGS